MTLPKKWLYNVRCPTLSFPASCHVTSRHVTSRHIMPRHATSRNVTSHVMSRHITSHHVTSCRITPRHATSHHVTSCHYTFFIRNQTKTLLVKVSLFFRDFSTQKLFNKFLNWEESIGRWYERKITKITLLFSLVQCNYLYHCCLINTT